MSLAADTVLVVLGLVAGALWFRPVAERCAGWPWWTVAGPLAALLGAAGWLAAVAPAGSGSAGAGRVLAVAVAVLGGSPVATAVLRGARPSSSALQASVEPDSGSGDTRPEEVLRGGLWIGALERAGAVVSLLAGSVEGVALVLAVKGVGRYPELRGQTAGMTEHFIIGTFASVLWAAAAAGVGHLLS